jgi:hypothetical protein
LLSGEAGGDDEDSDDIKKQIQEQEIAMRELNKTWAQKLEEAMLQKSQMDSESEQDKMNREKMLTHPHFMNMNEDPLLSGMIIVYFYLSNH